MKKIISILLVLVLTTVLFVGCSGDDTTDNATTDTNDTTNSSDSTEADADVVTTASIVTDADAVVAGLSADGAWILATLNDITVDEDIVVDGQFEHREAIDRKLALYAQDEDHNITEQYTLTAPKLIVKSENFRITGGTFKGDVYVEAPGFSLDKSATVDGNIYFASKELLDTFTVIDTAAITGTVQFDGVDVVTSASLITEAADIYEGLSANGTWIVAAYNNMILTQDLVVEGQFEHREAIARKLGLYTQDEDRNITASFTLTVPKMVIKSENFVIKGGTVVGDIYVEANGFELSDTTVEGNVYFASQENKDSMVIGENSGVTGVTEVQ